jgi:hypothetical protein
MMAMMPVLFCQQITCGLWITGTLAQKVLTGVGPAYFLRGRRQTMKRSKRAIEQTTGMMPNNPSRPSSPFFDPLHEGHCVTAEDVPQEH